jgi:hypothetical protein
VVARVVVVADGVVALVVVPVVVPAVVADGVLVGGVLVGGVLVGGVLAGRVSTRPLRSGLILLVTTPLTFCRATPAALCTAGWSVTR